MNSNIFDICYECYSQLDPSSEMSSQVGKDIELDAVGCQFEPFSIVWSLLLSCIEQQNKLFKISCHPCWNQPVWAVMNPSCMVCFQYYGCMVCFQSLTYCTLYLSIVTESVVTKLVRYVDCKIEIFHFQWNISIFFTFSVGRLQFLGFTVASVSWQMKWISSLGFWNWNVLSHSSYYCQVNLQLSANLKFAWLLGPYSSGSKIWALPFLFCCCQMACLHDCLGPTILDHSGTDLGSSFPLGPLLLLSNGLSLLWWNFCDDELL